MADQFANEKPRTVRVPMFDFSLASAVLWNNIFSAVLIAGAIAVAVGTFGTIKMTEIKERFADERVSENEAKTAQANQRAAEADARAAEANEKAEKERTARLQLEQRLAPRSFTKSQAEAFMASIRQFQGSAIDIAVFPGGTSDTISLSDDLATLLTAAGWTVRKWTMMQGSVLGVGVAVRQGNTEAEHRANVLIGALSAAGIMAARAPDLTSDSFPMPAVGPAPEGQIAPIRIYVGSKPI